MTVWWTGHGIESIPTGPVIQPVPVANVTFVSDGGTAELDAHIADERPHVNAESAKDFAGWFLAATT